MSVPVFQVDPLGYFIHISITKTTPVASALKKLLYLELSRSSNGDFKPLLGPDGGFTSETAARRFQMWNGRYHTRPHRKWNGYNFITAICNGHAPNGTKCPFCCNGYVNGCGRWPKWQKPTVLFLNGFFFGVGIFTVKKGCCILQTFWRPNEHARSVWCVISVRLLRSCGPSGSPLKYGGWYIYIYI